jgi:hypothetical protein
VQPSAEFADSHLAIPGGYHDHELDEETTNPNNPSKKKKSWFRRGIAKGLEKIGLRKKKEES